MNQTTTHPNEKTAQLCWTAFILMFFLIQACVWSFAISVTASDQSHAVVASYDEQALKWDDVKQTRQQSALLGWKAELLVDQAADIRGNRNLTLRLIDQSGMPLEKAKVQLRAFHRAAASQPQQIQFKEVGLGIYATTIEVDRFGKWCFSGTATIDQETFLVEQIIEVAKPSNIGNN